MSGLQPVENSAKMIRLRDTSPQLSFRARIVRFCGEGRAKCVKAIKLRGARPRHGTEYSHGDWLVPIERIGTNDFSGGQVREEDGMEAHYTRIRELIRSLSVVTCLEKLQAVPNLDVEYQFCGCFDLPRSRQASRKHDVGANWHLQARQLLRALTFDLCAMNLKPMTPWISKMFRMVNTKE